MGAVLEFPRPSKGRPESNEIIGRLIIKIQRETGIEWEHLRELTQDVMRDLCEEGFRVDDSA